MATKKSVKATSGGKFVSKYAHNQVYALAANVGGAPIWTDLVKSILNFSKRNKAISYIYETPPAIKDEETVWGNIPYEWRVGVNEPGLRLNNNCRLLQLQINPNSKDPTSGIDQGTAGTFLVASPKQTSNSVSNQEEIARARISTGAINLPNYETNKTGANSRMSHLCGFYIVEVKDDNTFYPFNVQAFSDGSFVHLGVRYLPNGKAKKLKAHEITRIDGDHHAAETDLKLSAMFDEIQNPKNKFGLQSDTLVSHDTWSQRVRNHHAEGQHIANAQNAEEGFSKVDEEKVVTRAFLQGKAKLHKRVVIVASNHNEALDQMLQKGRYITEDSINWKTGHILALAKYFNLDPVQFAVAGHYDHFLDKFKEYCGSIKEGSSKKIVLDSDVGIKNVTWLKKGERCRAGGHEIGSHGDDGTNGSKGSPKAMKTIYAGNSGGFDPEHGSDDSCYSTILKTTGSVSGHTHSPSLYNRTVVVGTSTYLPNQPGSPGYAKGKPSSWAQSFAFVYVPDDLKGESTAQLCNSIDYSWRLNRLPNMR